MGYSCCIATHPAVLNFQAFPVMRSILTIVTPVPCTEYLSGLVRLWRRIAARINSAPSLNCVLVIATR